MEEGEAEVVAADITTDGAPTTPRVLSRAPSRASSRPASRASVISTTEAAASPYLSVSEYLESQASTITTWLKESQSFEHGEEAEEVQTIISRSYSPATVSQFERSASSYQQENVPSGKINSAAHTAVVQVEVQEEVVGLIIERPADFAYGRSSPPLEMPAQISKAVELKSTETRTTTRTTTSTYTEHSCLVAYRYLYDITISKLHSLSLLVVNPECQYIDPEILERERERFAVRINSVVASY